MASSTPPQGPITAPLPRITIQFCTQCKWMLRAAYYAQELLSTFSLSIGEVALQPSTGGVFIVTIYHHQPSSSSSSSGAETGTTTAAAPATIQSTTLWDRKTDGGFPETKDLKRRVRDVIEPGRDLGHVDRDHHRSSGPSSTTTAAAATAAAAGAANSASYAATSAPAADGTTQDNDAPASAAATKEGTTTARQDKDSSQKQQQASSGIVCEDCN